eukprot:m.184546 g.184546  ORF g.184546 m.184546 type:complete len:59 (+) comp14715_c0_seq4:1382-1558(+)
MYICGVGLTLLTVANCALACYVLHVCRQYGVIRARLLVFRFSWFSAAACSVLSFMAIF